MTESVVWIVFLLTYLGLAFGKVPGLRIDRAGIALVGATAFLVTGVVAVPEAVAAVNFETILLLFGMMVVVAHLRLGGFFEQVMRVAGRHIRTPHGLLAATITLSAVLSAFLVNDIVCLALTPLVIRLARRLGWDPVPHLIGVATASNIGSVATIIGNPQNMIIGLESRISFLRFAARLTPIAVLGLVLDFVLLALVYREALNRKTKTGQLDPLAELEETPDTPSR